MFLALLCLAAYVVGATPFGLVAGKLVRGKGFDIREHGSGNIGATNVVRVLGKGVGIPVFVLDILKGLLPTLFAARMATVGSIPSWGAIPVALCCILGHNYTFWLGFKGGKGIATSGGALIGVMPVAALAGVVAWLIFAFLTRYVAVASIAAAIAVPLAVAIPSMRSGVWNWPLLAFAVFIGLMAILKHRSNIARLRAGTENRIGAKKNPT